MVRYSYAWNAAEFDKYDYKTNGIKRGQLSIDDEHNYKMRGSMLSAGLYLSARDVGNFADGAVARLTNQNKLDYMLTAGAFNLHKNNKTDLILNLNKYKKEALQVGAPTYGEGVKSNFFQRAGYHNVTNWLVYYRISKPRYSLFWSDR